MKKLLTLAAAALLVWGCGNSSENTAATENPESQAVEQTKESEESEENENVIELNQGEKWLVNEEMKPFIMKGEELVNNYIQQQQTDHNGLAQQLKDQNDQLIKSCTMEGKSHDELHKWLHPHLDLVKKLSKETDAVKAAETVTALQVSYSQYHQYFN